jgi:7-cyano-7-deazaguanine synthase in queuosine biosynthesis
MAGWTSPWVVVVLALFQRSACATLYAPVNLRVDRLLARDARGVESSVPTLSWDLAEVVPAGSELESASHVMVRTYDSSTRDYNGTAGGVSSSCGHCSLCQASERVWV